MREVPWGLGWTRPGEQSWDGPLEKFGRRAQGWCTLPAGLLRAMQHYRYFVFSILSFLMQVEDVPEKALKMDASALRQFVPGAGN